jgi:hypothetical protein
MFAIEATDNVAKQHCGEEPTRDIREDPRPMVLLCDVAAGETAIKIFWLKFGDDGWI